MSNPNVYLHTGCTGITSKVINMNYVSTKFIFELDISINNGQNFELKMFKIKVWNWRFDQLMKMKYEISGVRKLATKTD